MNKQPDLQLPELSTLPSRNTSRMRSLLSVVLVLVLMGGSFWLGRTLQQRAYDALFPSVPRMLATPDQPNEIVDSTPQLVQGDVPSGTPPAEQLTRKDELEKRANIYPVDADGLFARGTVWASDLSKPNDQGVQTITLYLKEDGIGHVIGRTEKSYELTIQSPQLAARIPGSLDFLGDPRVSFDEKYVCLKAAQSGFSGYYVASLPDGKFIDLGIQYSSCVTWIDDHRVLVAEQEYNTRNNRFFILDAQTKEKQILSQFQIKTEE